MKQGIREAALLSLSFCAVVSALIFVFARPLLTLFIDPGETEILDIGVHYLRVEGVFYVGIGLLFLLYAIYRGLEQAGMSVVLTVISLGLRVVLAYAFGAAFRRDGHLAGDSDRLVHRGRGGASAPSRRVRKNGWGSAQTPSET